MSIVERDVSLMLVVYEIMRFPKYFKFCNFFTRVPNVLKNFVSKVNLWGYNPKKNKLIS